MMQNEHTKVIYFDRNDNMYTADEIENLQKEQKLTRMVVRVSEQERQHQQRARSVRKTRGLEGFIHKI